MHDDCVCAHKERKVPFRRSDGDPRLIKAISAHVETHIGPIGQVWHDLISDTVRVDLLWVRPGPDRNFHTLVTCGMSERPMFSAEGPDDGLHAELLLRLPADWPLPGRGMNDEGTLWPLMELTTLARMPHVYKTLLWAGHSVVNGDPPEPLAATTRFAGTVVLPVAWLPPPFHFLEVEPARMVHFFSAVPLYPDELLIARSLEPTDLIHWLEQAGIGDLLDVHRSSVVGVPH